MKKIYESQLNGWGESAERVYVYALENDDEYWNLSSIMSHKEMCEYFDVFDEADHEVLPGAIYKTYSFSISSNHAIMYETIAYNV